jgi:ELWxxDGT repeat protein
MSDRTEAGTMMIRDIQRGSISSAPMKLVYLGFDGV